jgi:hypothetical protein
MAETKITCPECGKVLRPAKPLPAGKRVKCPQCSAMFVPQEDDESTAAVSKEPAKSAAKTGGKAAGKSKPAKQAADDKPAKSTAPAKPGMDDDEDGPATYDFIDGHSKGDEPEIDYVPDTSIKDLRGPAQAAIMKPSNFMIGVGVLGCLCYFLFLCVVLIPIVFPVPPQTNADGTPVVEKPKEKSGEEGEVNGSLFMVFGWDLMDSGSYEWYSLMGLILGLIAGMVVCGISTYGAVRMQTLESRLWGMIAGIMLMIPSSAMGTFVILVMIATATVGRFCGLGFVFLLTPLLVLASFGINIAVGIWSIVLLNRQDVVDGYNYVPDDQKPTKRKRD